MSACDVMFIIVWNAETDAMELWSNIKDEALDEVFGHYILDQVCSSSKGTTDTKRNVYTVRVGLWFEDDVFGTESDCGSNSLETGIVMDALRRLREKQLPQSGGIAEWSAKYPEWKKT